MPSRIRAARPPQPSRPRVRPSRAFPNRTYSLIRFSPLRATRAPRRSDNRCVFRLSNRTSAMDSNYVRIFDTSLRDGEQAPGASMTSAEKLEVARTLARLGVDVIESGFPAASPDDLAAVQSIAA